MKSYNLYMNFSYLTYAEKYCREYMTRQKDMLYLLKESNAMNLGKYLSFFLSHRERM